MTAASARLLSPEEIAVRAGSEIPFLRFPERSTLFAEREMRLRQLAAAHPMRDFLLFVAEVARAQQAALDAAPALTLPTPAELEAAARDGAAPLAPDRHLRDPRWLGVLRQVLAALDARLPPGPARDVVRGLAAMPDAHVQQQADRILNGITLGLDLATAPLVAAGLQVTLTHTLLATRDAHAAAPAAPTAARFEAFGRVDDQTRCPGCAQLPVASVTRIGAAEAGHRYLQCAWCGLQWHMVRIKCAHCLSTKGISYQSLAALDDDAAPAEPAESAPTRSKAERAAMEGEGGAGRPVELECCGECHHYLKIVHMERDREVEPVADDLATITLDLLAAESGLQRHGHDPMLVFGDPDAGAEPARPEAGPP